MSITKKRSEKAPIGRIEQKAAITFDALHDLSRMTALAIELAEDVSRFETP